MKKTNGIFSAMIGWLCAFLMVGVTAEAVVYSTGSASEDWLNASNWGGTNPQNSPNETFVIKSGHTLGPAGSGASATQWPTAGLQVDAGGTLSLNKGNADLSGAANGLKLNGGTIRVSSSATNPEAEVIGDVEITAASTVRMDADSFAFSGGNVTGSYNVDLRRTVSSSDTGDGFPAVLLKSRMFDYSGDIATSSWAGWGRFVVQTGNWGAGDFTMNPQGGGVIRPGMSFVGHGKLIVPNSNSKVDLKHRSHIFFPGTSFGGNAPNGNYHWVNDNTSQFTDILTASGSRNISAYLINTDEATFAIKGPATSAVADMNNIYYLDEPVSTKNMARIISKAKDASVYVATLNDPNQLPYPLGASDDTWVWSEPYIDIFRIDGVYQMTHDKELIDAGMAIADNIQAFLDHNPSLAPSKVNPLYMMKFVAPAVTARLIFEHASRYPNEISTAQLNKAKDYLQWSVTLFNRFAVTDGDRPAVRDTANGLYPIANRVLKMPWNRQLWWVVPCAVAREAMSAYNEIYPNDTTYRESAQDYQKIVLGAADKFFWNCQINSINERDCAFWGYGTERKFTISKANDPDWVDDLDAGERRLGQYEDTAHMNPDIWAYAYLADLADKRPEYAVFREIAQRVTNSGIDYGFKRANDPSAATDPRAGPVNVVVPPWRGKGEYKGFNSRGPGHILQLTALYRSDIYFLGLGMKGWDDNSLYNYVLGKIVYQKAAAGVPAAPQFVTKENQSGWFIDWPRSPEPDVTGYNVYRASSSGGPYVRIATDVAQSEYLDSAGSGHYVVTAVDSTGKESAYSVEAATSALPTAPSNLRVTTANGGVKLVWDASADADVIGYNVYRSHGGSTAFHLIREGVKGTVWLDDWMQNNTLANPPHYKVTAVNSKYKASSFSNEATLSQSEFVVYDDRLVVDAVSGSGSLDLTANDVLVDWENPVEIHTVGDSIVSKNGTLVRAANLNGNNTTVNGVPFVKSTWDSWHTSLLNSNGGGSGSYSGGSVSSSFETLLDSFRSIDRRIGYEWIDGATPGKAYELQLFVSSENWLENLERQFSLYGVKSPSHKMGPGFSIKCRFTANQWHNELMFSNKGGSVAILLNGYQLREIPAIQNAVILSVTQPANGSVTRNGNVVTYTPDSGFTGVDQFTYQVREQNTGATGTGVVDVVVDAEATPSIGNQTPRGVIVATTNGSSLAVGFDGSQSLDDGTIVAYEWDFDGDGAIDATSPTASHTFPSAGDYAITLSVTDDQGTVGVAAKTISVGGAPPLAPILWYKMDETSGTTLADASGHNYPGTASSSSFVPSGKYDRAYQFTGSNKITIPNSIFDEISGQMTVTMWTKDDDGSYGNQVLFHGEKGGHRYQFGIWGNLVVKFAGQEITACSESEFANGGAWTHWAFVADAESGLILVYQDGQLLTSQGRSMTLDKPDVVQLGMRYNYSGFAGYMDDVRIYNKALSQSQVSTVMTSSTMSPVAFCDATPTTGTDPLTVSFDGSASVDADGTIQSYEWDFDSDGTVDATGVTATHVYSQGTYTATLTVTDNDNLSHSDIRTITVTSSGGTPSGPTPLVWYKLDETSGTSVADASGNGYHGTAAVAPSWQPAGGKYDGAYQSTDQNYITVPASAFTQLSTAATISFWMKGSSDMGNIFFGTTSGDYNSGGSMRALAGRAGTGGYSFDAGHSGSAYSYRNLQATTPEPNVNAWEHWTLTTDSAANEMILYRNGAELARRTQDRDVAGITYFIIGQGNYGRFKGALDDFRIYAKALSPSEITTVMNNSTGPVIDTTTDSDSDGVTDFLEDAFGTDPNDGTDTPDLFSDFQPQLNGNVDYQVRNMTAGYTYELQTSTNLVSGSWQTVTNFVGSGGPSTVTIDKSKASGDGQLYMRIKVTK